MSTVDTEDFPASMRLLSLGPAHQPAYVCPPLQATLTRKLIRQSDPETFHLLFTQQGCMGISHRDQEILAAQDSLVLLNSS
ncbi:hypothetical protein AB0I22_33610 [Streptomyces sp. NPDC050610]|uniref:hypothetical protein n=1 Tax=Streptomyces sp. NPDC050610 TaxID=3157097 RepID=UPI00343F129B